MRTVKLGLGGLGTVGGGVAKLIAAHHDEYLKKYDVDVQIAAVCCREMETVRTLGLEDVFVADFNEMATNPQIDIIIELFGGTGAAKALVEAALKAGKRVVTANKALLAAFGPELFALAEANGTEIAFEASVGGGIPIIAPLTSSLAPNKIERIAGIMNGTTNYMLTRMAREGLDYDAALKEAQELGYAEANPTADVEGHDAAAKIAILASLAFGSTVSLDDVSCEGISALDSFDVDCAIELGYVVKLLAIGQNTPEGIDVRVHPALVPIEHPLAMVDDVFNAIYVEGDFVGETMFYGKGAGSLPTASAVTSDILRIARDLEQGTPLRALSFGSDPLKLIDPASARSRYYIRVNGLLDEEITPIFANHNIYIEEVYGISAHECECGCEGEYEEEHECCCGEHDHNHEHECACGEHDHDHECECEEGDPDAMLYITAPVLVSNMKACAQELSQNAENVTYIRIETFDD